MVVIWWRVKKTQLEYYKITNWFILLEPTQLCTYLCGYTYIYSCLKLINIMLP